MARIASTLSLHPDHFADLRERSGLSEETIQAAGVRSLAPAEWPRFLSQRLAAKVQSCYLIPYPEADGFYRVKLLPPVPDKDGHTIRYHQPPGTAPRLYLPPRARAALADPSIPLLVTEGEKKALKTDQEGLACAALGGLWSWLLDGQPLPDLGRVDWCEREGLLAPDSDVWTRPDLLRAVYAFGKELEMRGANVAVLKLPAGPDGNKVGLDDFLVAHSADELLQLPRLALNHRVWAKTATWWREWIKRKQAESPTQKSGVLELLERGETVRFLHPAQDVVDGVLSYGLAIQNELVLITSKRDAYRADQLQAGPALRHTDPGPSSVGRDVALRWLSGEACGSVVRALDLLVEFFSRFIVFRDLRMVRLLAAWTVGTWCYRAFPIYPYLAISSPEKRCGKTRLLKLLRLVGFNASPVTTTPTEALLFREAERTSGVQLLDEADHLRGDKDRFDALISVLNAGFERGQTVPRLEKRGERFVQIPYEVYAPRAIAGIAELKDTLEDRAIPIFMSRRRKDEPVARLTRAVEAESQALRDACALACLTRIGDILTAYDQAPALLEREAIDDRGVDLWMPPVALSLVADVEDAGDRTAQLLALARELSNLRDADAETGQTARLVAALDAIRKREGKDLAPAELLAALRAQPGWDWVKSVKRLAGLLNQLGLFREQRRDGGRRKWAYSLGEDALKDLKARYGASADLDSEGG